MYSRIKEATRLLGAITLAILLFACEKEETAPKVQTVSAVATSSTQFEAKASLIERGTLEIIDYGFIPPGSTALWDNVNLKPTQLRVKSLVVFQPL